MPDKDVRLSRGRIRWEAHLISGAKACSTSFCRLEFCQSPGFHTARRPMSRFSTVGASASHSFGARCLKKVNFWPTGDNLWRSCIVFTVEATPTVVTGPTGLEGKKCNLSQAAPPLLALAENRFCLFPVLQSYHPKDRQDGGLPYGRFPWLWRYSPEASRCI
jgi:hypothetical protein